MQSIKRLKKARAQGGFTLIELLVVIGILAILLAITLIALNPNQHFQGARNAQRSSNVSEILNAIYEYEAQNSGNLPTNLQGSIATPTAISSTGIDLCNLTPTYIADLPTDPDSTYGTVAPAGNTPCSTGTTAYDTGYTIVKSGTRFTVTAPHAEGGATISVTR